MQLQDLTFIACKQLMFKIIWNAQERGHETGGWVFDSSISSMPMPPYTELERKAVEALSAVDFWYFARKQAELSREINNLDGYNRAANDTNKYWQRFLNNRQYLEEYLHSQLDAEDEAFIKQYDECSDCDEYIFRNLVFNS